MEAYAFIVVSVLLLGSITASICALIDALGVSEYLRDLLGFYEDTLPEWRR